VDTAYTFVVDVDDRKWTSIDCSLNVSWCVCATAEIYRTEYVTFKYLKNRIVGDLGGLTSQNCTWFLHKGRWLSSALEAIYLTINSERTLSPVSVYKLVIAARYNWRFDKTKNAF